MSKNNNILFDANSVALDSPVFILDSQVTVIATGMAPDDYITFEILELKSGDPLKLCGCRIIEGTNAVIDLAKPLTCAMCGPEVNQQEVRLTELGTFVIIDAPQGVLMRAIYHGTGIDDHTVKVWYNNSDTPDLNDAMRGCAPLEAWEDTGETRCDVPGDILEIQQVSSCGALQWVPGPPLTWAATGETRCNILLTIMEVQEVNDCGDFRWVDGDAFEWVRTGLRDCTADPSGYLLMQEISPCGDLRWVTVSEGEGDTLVEWLATGEVICDEGLLFVQERNQCGEIRLVATGSGDVEWVPTGEVACEWLPRENLEEFPQYTTTVQEVDNCGNLRWVAGEGPIEGVLTSGILCVPEFNAIVIILTNPCNSLAQWHSAKTEEAYWIRTGQVSCNEGEVILLEEKDFCGNVRWVEDPSGAPAWHNSGGDCSYNCNPDTGYLFRIQQSSCCGGGTRLVQVFEEDGITPVAPEWLSTGTYRCNANTDMVEVQDRSQCNEYRWTECSPITWTATGEVRVFNGTSQLQAINPCGEIIWRDIPPESIVWTVTGVQACVDGYFQNQETDGFGNVRTVTTTEPCGCGDSPVLQNVYDSDWQLYTGRRGKPGFVTTLYTFLHGLGVTPDFVTLEFRCKVAQGSYTVGDIVVANVHSADQQNGVSTGWAIRIDPLNITLAIDYNNGASLHSWNNINNFRLANGSWEFRIRGYA